MNIKGIITLVFLLSSTMIFAQSPTTKPEVTQSKNKVETAPNYQLFPTQNMWTFIKLDTRNGKMWQVQYSVGEGKGRSESVLSSLSLTIDDQDQPGRFTLYPTQNIYNFMLLDQIKGYVYQVQWSLEQENRLVIPIF